MTSLNTTVGDAIDLAPVVPSGGGGAPSASEILSMIRRRIVMIALLFAVFSALTVGGFAVWWLYFPGYRGECLIECISNIPATELTLDQQRLKQDEHERFVRTQAVLLKSPGILAEALKVNAVRETDWFARIRAGGHEPLIELNEQLAAAPVRGTNFLRVAMDCRNPEDSPVIVNEVVNQWYHTVKKRTADDFTSDALEAAREERRKLVAVIASQRDQLRAIAERLPAGALRSAGNNITAQQVEEYGRQVAQLQLETSQLEQFRAIYNDPEGVAVTAEDRTAVEQGLQVAELTRRVFLLNQQRAADLQVFGAEHKAVKQLAAQIGADEESLAQLRLQKLRERQADLREAANTAYENSRHALFIAQEKLRGAEAQQQDQDALLFEYSQFSRELRKDLEYEVELDTYVRGLARVKAQKTAIKVNIAQAAIQPLERSTPGVWLVPMGILLSLGLSVTLALGLELLDKSIRTSQDIVKYLDVAMLGAVPDTDDEEVSIGHVETAVRDAPRSMVAEAFRRIRTNLQFSAPAERQRSVLVTSPRPEDGTTTVACNLAFAVAQGGRRVLLVDANMRRPALRRIFDNVGVNGLSNILIDEGTLSECVSPTDQKLLDVLGSGPTVPNPVELLSGRQWRAFLDEAMSKYDQVIIDTAPVLLASDAVVLATAVDGVVLTVRAKRNSRGVARRAWSLLADVNAHIFGAVLNAAQVTRGGYFREQLRDYYDYQQDPPSPDADKPIART
ncbi:MAG: polysaccharide biosynthesis tyrosine autokinase [Planctomycetes bacterium]|nr:polysaccharide biosynthesis tyrosine autokinase [Planctomycetota bacterium]